MIGLTRKPLNPLTTKLMIESAIAGTSSRAKANRQPVSIGLEEDHLTMH